MYMQRDRRCRSLLTGGQPTAKYSVTPIQFCSGIKSLFDIPNLRVFYGFSSWYFGEVRIYSTHPL